MAFHHPPKKQQGQYRYDPTQVSAQGPARVFPYAGDDGVLRYILSELGKSLLEDGKVSQPWVLVLSQAEARLRSVEQAWYYLTTQWVDWEIFQSGWFNLDLPPDEQFDVPFVRERRTMMETLLTAQKAAQGIANKAEARSQFYDVLQRFGQPHPITWQIHQRDRGLSDREFVRQRLAGQNPMMVRRIQPGDGAWLEAWHGLAKPRSQGDAIDLVQAAANNQLFVVDYPFLERLTPADLQPGRYVGNPVALFSRTQTGLEPLLIQLETGRILTPADGDAWMQAKLYVQVADVTYHELVVHLADTHLAMEAFAIATPRQLPANHPLFRLLQPHFKYLLAINTRGNQVLLSEGAAIDKLMAPTRAASLALINVAYRERDFQSHALPTHLKHQGIEAEALPNYPYRDDALLLWNAIAQYVTAFLQRYYPDDSAVQHDPYLQAWAAELGEPLNKRPLTDFPQAPAWLPPHLTETVGLSLDRLPNYPRVPGFPTRLSSLQHVIDIATQIIFTCGPQHAAVNFSQFDYVGYVPNAPLAAYAQPDVCTALEDLLPPVEQDIAQIELTFALCGIRWGQLGSSKLIQFQDKGDRAVLKQFQTNLAAIEHKISDRNRQRVMDDGCDYPYLLPSRIPNSINI